MKPQTVFIPDSAAGGIRGRHVVRRRTPRPQPIVLPNGMNVPDTKPLLYEQLARLASALAAPRRVELLDILTQGPGTVEVLARASGQSVANASKHLKVLRAARLVDAGKRGLFVTYRLADPSIASLLVALRQTAEKQLLELRDAREELLRATAGVEKINRRDLQRRIRAGEAVLIDVRPAEEFAAGHLPGAVSIPLKDLKARLAEIPHRQEIVAYCRGPYCRLAVEAVQFLRKSGRSAKHLADGVAEWRAAGLRIDEGAEATR